MEDIFYEMTKARYKRSFVLIENFLILVFLTH